MTMVTLASAQDKIPTKNGELTLNFIGHGSLYIEYKHQIIHVDPYSAVGDYSRLPKADYILLTHEHRDHLDQGAIKSILKPDTKFVAPEVCRPGLKAFSNILYLANYDSFSLDFLSLKAVPAYNIQNVREPGKPYHPKGEGNGYVLTIDGTNIYIAGDTENIPEMADLPRIDVAFLPMNLPYTMTPQMVADAAKMVKPKILYPYHFGETDTNELLELLKDSGIEVRIREMK